MLDAVRHPPAPSALRSILRTSSPSARATIAWPGLVETSGMCNDSGAKPILAAAMPYLCRTAVSEYTSLALRF
jgi:hypothetical protein